MTTIPPEVIVGASRCIYACRPWSDTSRGMRMTCADCGAGVTVTPSALAESRRQTHALGRSLAVVCDARAVTEAVAAGAVVRMLAPDGSGA